VLIGKQQAEGRKGARVEVPGEGKPDSQGQGPRGESVELLWTGRGDTHFL